MDKPVVTQSSPRFRKTFLILCAVYALSFTAIFRADFYYIDDLARTFEGYQGWENFSRYMSVFSSTLLHTDTYLTDISPLTQWVAVAILALCSTFVIYLCADGHFNSWLIPAVLPMGLSPYFLECISYKYDSPYMALAFFGMIAPLMLEKKSYKLYIPAVFLGTLLMCTTYQAASGVLPVLVISIAFSRWNQGQHWKDLLKFILLSAVAYCAGMLFFDTVLLVPFDHYITSSILPLGSLLKGSIKNLLQFYQLISADFRMIWKVLIGIITVGYVVVQTLQSTRNKLAAFCMASASVLAMYALAFGAYIALETPIFEPRALYGFGVLIAILAVGCCNSPLLTKRYVLKLACCILSWSLIVFAFTYGNALKEQKRYTDFRIEMVMSDLKDLDEMRTDHQKYYQLSGIKVISPVIDNIPEDYGVLRRLVPNPFAGTSYYWSNYYFLHYFGMKNIETDYNIDMTAMDLPVVKDTMYHTIRSDGTYLLIELKN